MSNLKFASFWAKSRRYAAMRCLRTIFPRSGLRKCLAATLLCVFFRDIPPRQCVYLTIQGEALRAWDPGAEHTYLANTAPAVFILDNDN